MKTLSAPIADMPSNATQPRDFPAIETAQHAAAAIGAVAKTVAPVWPLADFVAVNPYMGMSDRTFLDARKRLQRFSDCDTLMPLAYYQDRYDAGEFDRLDLDQAIEELVADRVPGAESLQARASIERLKAPTPSADAAGTPTTSHVLSISADYDERAGTAWTPAIHEEVGKHCAAYYDQGQSQWASPWKHLSLYGAWRAAMRHDRKLEVLGIRGVRQLIAGLPASPDDAIAALLQSAGVPVEHWEDYLHCLAFELPGWSAWAEYQTTWTGADKQEHSALSSLIAIRLAYDVALSASFDTTVDWDAKPPAGDAVPSDDDLQRYALLKANEVGYRRKLLCTMQAAASDDSGTDSATDSASQRKLAQMVFCIDVRSERIRRQLEATDQPIETLGFAGFFGLPFEYERMGETSTTNQLPVLISPQFKVKQTIRGKGHTDGSSNRVDATLGQRGFVRLVRKQWKAFRGASVSAFAFVESVGPFFGLKLLAKLTGYQQGSTNAQNDGVAPELRPYASPDLQSLSLAGIDEEKQSQMAHSILKGMGLTSDFARLVVFCGHGSQTTNNPLEAGLDCGACGGHSGEPNARLAAMLLNQPHVRKSLAESGIVIPEDTHFVGGLHNTTTDALTFFDTDLLPSTHQDDLEQLKQAADTASAQNRLERLSVLSSDNPKDTHRRSGDWSEVRPEWGLTGNAAFVVGPRRLTSSLNLSGRSFLHNYDHRNDPEGAVLEAIMTAPMVVTSWINLQYYASTVDQKHFGSGRKTIHNVVGQFGVYSGNGGDLTTGLPWESLHDGERYHHDPVRLLTVIAAPREVIAGILGRHESVANLVVNGWLNLVARDGDGFYRFTADHAWELIRMETDSRTASPPQPNIATVLTPEVTHL